MHFLTFSLFLQVFLQVFLREQNNHCLSHSLLQTNKREDVYLPAFYYSPVLFLTYPRVGLDQDPFGFCLLLPRLLVNTKLSLSKCPGSDTKLYSHAMLRLYHQYALPCIPVYGIISRKFRLYIINVCVTYSKILSIYRLIYVCLDCSYINSEKNKIVETYLFQLLLILNICFPLNASRSGIFYITQY